MIRNIIFDWSGTLVDDLPAVWAATNLIFRERGLAELTLDEFRREFCLPFKSFYERFAPGFAMEHLEDSFQIHFDTVQQHVRDLPHAKDFLQFCRDHGVRTFLLSSVSGPFFQRQSAQNGFDRFIDTPYTGVWDKKAKIAAVLEENGLIAAETIFIGDMQHDIETARHGGIGSCAVLTGYNRLEQLRLSQPDVIVEHLGELRENLERSGFKSILRPSEDSSGPGRPVCTVGALIGNADGHVLMVRTQKWSGLWGIPGGKIKAGETAVEALRREILEETNLEVRDICFVTGQDCINSPEFYRPVHFFLLNYTCQTDGTRPVKLNDEAEEFRWVTRAEAMTMPLNTPTRILLQRTAAQKTASPMDTIIIKELEAFFRVGVPEAERSQRQRLLLNIELQRDFSAAAAQDDLRHTIDYHAVARRIERFGGEKNWKLIETLAVELAEMILAEFSARAVSVEIQKFILPETRYVAVRVYREAKS